MREAVLAALLLPYLYYGGMDNFFHFRGRVVSYWEHMLHLALGFAAVGLVLGVFRGDRAHLLRAVPVLLVCGALDEYVFHRGIPEAETDMHAKAHWALLVFAAAGLLWN